MSMHPDCERIMLSEEQLRSRVKEIALEVDKIFAGKRPLVVGILKGSIIFYSDFIRHLSMPVELDFMAVRLTARARCLPASFKSKRIWTATLRGAT